MIFEEKVMVIDGFTGKPERINNGYAICNFSDAEKYIKNRGKAWLERLYIVKIEAALINIDDVL